MFSEVGLAMIVKSGEAVVVGCTTKLPYMEKEWKVQ